MAYTYLIMITLIRPILFSFMQSEKVKFLILDLLKAYAKTTDNNIDDKIVGWVRDALFPNK